MKDLPVSNCEKEFVEKALTNGSTGDQQGKSMKRLDGRGVYEQRKFQLTFGKDYGCCMVKLGKTIVFCQVSAEIGEPKIMRPNEGGLFINLDVSPAASPAFVDKRNSELIIPINCILEKTIKESRAVDLESLCIISGEKVWSLRIDLQVLNYEGNILDCASVAAMAGLAHFRRPDITIDDGKITVHPVYEKEPVPLSVLHYPFTVSIAFFLNGEYLLVDPNLLEERVCDGCVIAALNRHSELCSLQLAGRLLITEEQIERCLDIAGKIVDDLTKYVQSALEAEEQKRRKGDLVGFVSSYDTAPTMEDVFSIQPYVSDVEEHVDDTKNSDEAQTPDQEVMLVSDGVIGLGGPSAWEPVTISSGSSEDEEPSSEQSFPKQDVVQVDSDSEEEVVTLTEKQFKRSVNEKKFK